MTGLLVPPDVAREQMVDDAMDDTYSRAREFAVELKRIDPHLGLVWAGEKADFPGLKPCRWHVKRHNPGTVDSYWPIEGPDGGYMEPHSGVFEQLMRNDLWRGDPGRARYHRECENARRRQRAKDREAEDRRVEFAERLKALASPGVSFARAGGWSYRAGARRGR